MDPLTSIFQSLQQPDHGLRSAAEQSFNSFLLSPEAVPSLICYSLSPTHVLAFKHLAIILLTRHVKKVWRVDMVAANKQQLLDSMPVYLSTEDVRIRTAAIVLISEIYSSGYKEEKSRISACVLSLLRAHTSTSFTTALKCLCAITTVADSYELFDLIKVCYADIVSLGISNKDAPPQVKRRVTKLMRMFVARFVEVFMDEELEETTENEFAAFISSWSTSVLQSLIVECTADVSLIQLNLGALIEAFQYFQIALEAIPGVLECHVDILQAALATLKTIVTFQSSGVDNYNALFGEHSVYSEDGYISDGDRLDFEILIIQILEVIDMTLYNLPEEFSEDQRSSVLQTVIQFSFQFSQLTPNEQEMWVRDPNQFVHEQGDESYDNSIRRSCAQLTYSCCDTGANGKEIATFLEISKSELFRIIQLKGTEGRKEHSAAEVLRIEGILWILSSVSSCYSKMVSKYRRLQREVSTSTTAGASKSTKKKLAKLEKSFAAVPIAHFAQFMSTITVHFISDSDCSALIKARCYGLYCEAAIACELKMTRGHIVTAVRLLSDLTLAVPMRIQVVRCLGKILHRAAKMSDNLPALLESAIETAEGFGAEAASQLMQLHLQQQQAAGGTAAGTAAVASSAAAYPFCSALVMSVVNSCLHLVQECDENTVHFLVETITELVKTCPLSLTQSASGLIVVFCSTTWSSYVKDTMVVEMCYDLCCFLMKYRSAHVLNALLHHMLPFACSLLADQSSAGGTHAAAVQHTSSSSSSSSSISAETHWRCSPAATSRINACAFMSKLVVTADRSGHPALAQVCRRSVLSALSVVCASRNMTTVVHRNVIFQSLCTVISSCICSSSSSSSASVSGLFTDMSEMQSFVAIVEPLVTDSFRRLGGFSGSGDVAAVATAASVGGDDDDEEEEEDANTGVQHEVLECTDPTVGLWCHLLLYFPSAMTEETRVGLVHSALVLQQSSASSEGVAYAITMGFVHMFARDPAMVVQLVNAASQTMNSDASTAAAGGAVPNPAVLLSLINNWFSFHNVLQSKYNGTVSSFGLISLVQLFTSAHQYSEAWAGRVLALLLARLPAVLMNDEAVDEHLEFDMDGGADGVGDYGEDDAEDEDEYDEDDEDDDEDGFGAMMGRRGDDNDDEEEAEWSAFSAAVSGGLGESGGGLEVAGSGLGSAANSPVKGGGGSSGGAFSRGQVVMVNITDHLVFSPPIYDPLVINASAAVGTLASSEASQQQLQSQQQQGLWTDLEGAIINMLRGLQQTPGGLLPDWVQSSLNAKDKHLVQALLASR